MQDCKWRKSSSKTKSEKSNVGKVSPSLESELIVVMDIDSLKAVSTAEKAQLTSELTSYQQRLTDLQSQLQTLRRDYDLEKEDSLRRHRIDEDTLRREHQRELETVTRTLKEQCAETEKKGKDRLEEEIRRAEREIRDVKDREGTERDILRRDIDIKERELRSLKNEVENLRADLEREQATNRHLKVLPYPRHYYLNVCILILVNGARTIGQRSNTRSHHPRPAHKARIPRNSCLQP